jgi:hypothetical protein
MVELTEALAVDNLPLGVIPQRDLRNQDFNNNSNHNLSEVAVQAEVLALLEVVVVAQNLKRVVGISQATLALVAVVLLAEQVPFLAQPELVVVVPLIQVLALLG